MAENIENSSNGIALWRRRKRKQRENNGMA